MLPCCLLASLLLPLAALDGNGFAPQGDPSYGLADHPAREVLTDAHDVFNDDFWNLSEDQKKQARILEGKLAKKFRDEAGMPSVNRMYSDALIMAQFRALLTDGQQAVYDVILGPDEKLAQTLRHVEEGIFTLGREIDGLSASEREKAIALLQSAAKRLKADPQTATASPDDFFLAKVMPEFGAILSDAHREKYAPMLQERLRKMQVALTTEHLRRIAISAMERTETASGGLADDLGALAADLDPLFFLMGGSKVEIPADFTMRSAREKADWVNQNTDFVFLGADKNRIGPFVIAYIKPELAKEGNRFALADGNVHALDIAASAKLIAELQARQNASLKQE